MILRLSNSGHELPETNNDGRRFRSQKRLFNRLEDIETEMLRRFADLRSAAELDPRPEVKEVLQRIREDEEYIRRMCVASVMDRDAQRELHHDLTNNDATLGLYEELERVMGRIHETAISKLNSMQRLMYRRGEAMGFRMSRNASS